MKFLDRLANCQVIVMRSQPISSVDFGVGLFWSQTSLLHVY